jgi:hypothetical protein
LYFELGCEVLKRNEPLIGYTRVETENAVQDYRNRILERAERAPTR